MEKREWKAEEKYRIVLQGISGKKSVADICRENRISSQQYYRWRDLFLKGGQEALKDRRVKVNRDPLEEENRRLKKLVGEYALIIDSQKKLYHLEGE